MGTHKVKVTNYTLSDSTASASTGSAHGYVANMGTGTGIDSRGVATEQEVIGSMSMIPETPTPPPPPPGSELLSNTYYMTHHSSSSGGGGDQEAMSLTEETPPPGPPPDTPFSPEAHLRLHACEGSSSSDGRPRSDSNMLQVGDSSSVLVMQPQTVPADSTVDIVKHNNKQTVNATTGHVNVTAGDRVYM